MTDLTPNDLSHLSDEEFNALCPQGYHAPGPAEPFSPAAQAILDAYGNFEPADVDAMAAALRAAAAHCHSQEIREADYTTRHWVCVDELLAIAAELEGKGND